MGIHDLARARAHQCAAVIVALTCASGCFAITDLDRFEQGGETGTDQIVLAGFGEFDSDRIEIMVVDTTDVGAITLVGRAVVDGLQPADEAELTFTMVHVFRPDHDYQVWVYVDEGRDGVRDASDPSFIGTVQNGAARVSPDDVGSFDAPPAAVGTLPMVLRLTEMDFHTTEVQLFELALVDVERDTVVGYFRLADVNEAAFEVVVPGIVSSGTTYDLEFWADANQNGTFDRPPNDHSWVRQVVATDTGVELDFVHVGIFEDLPHL